MPYKTHQTYYIKCSNPACLAMLVSPDGEPSSVSHVFRPCQCGLARYCSESCKKAHQREHLQTCNATIAMSKFEDLLSSDQRANEKLVELARGASSSDSSVIGSEEEGTLNSEAANNEARKLLVFWFPGHVELEAACRGDHFIKGGPVLQLLNLPKLEAVAEVGGEHWWKALEVAKSYDPQNEVAVAAAMPLANSDTVVRPFVARFLSSSDILSAG